MSASVRLLPESVFNPKLYARILSLWFGNLPASATVPDEKTGKRWFSGGSKEENATFDDDCTKLCTDALKVLSPEQWPLPLFESFEADRKAAPLISAPFRSAIERDSSRGPEALAKADIALSLTLLLDQLSRNAFRDAAGQKLVYTHYDRLSRSLTTSIIHGVAGTESDVGPDIKDLDVDPKYRLYPVRRAFFYMPLMHSEDLVYHDDFSTRTKAMSDDMAKTGDEESKKYVDMSLEFERKHRALIEQFGRYPHRNKCLGRTPTEAEVKFLADGGDTFGAG